MPSSSQEKVILCIRSFERTEYISFNESSSFVVEDLAETMTHHIQKLKMRIEDEPEDTSTSKGILKYSKRTYWYSVFPEDNTEIYLDIIPEKIVLLPHSNMYKKANVHLGKDISSSITDFIERFYEKILSKLKEEPELKDKKILMNGPFHYDTKTTMRVKFQKNLMKSYDAFYEEIPSSIEFTQEVLSRINRIQIRIGHIHMINVHTDTPTLVIVPCVRKVFLS
jgi:hypothetical protein